VGAMGIEGELIEKMRGRGHSPGSVGIVGEAVECHGSAPREARPRPCAAFWRSKSRERLRPAPKGEARRAGAQRRTASTAFLSREEWRHTKRRSRAGVATGEESRAQPL